MKYFEADPKFFKLVSKLDVNSVEFVDEFKRCQFALIFKNKPGNNHSK